MQFTALALHRTVAAERPSPSKAGLTLGEVGPAFVSNKNGHTVWHALKLRLIYYRALFFLNFAQRFLCAAAILSRAPADSLRLAPEVPVLPLNAAIARFSLSRSFFNVASTAPRFIIFFSLGWNKQHRVNDTVTRHLYS